MKWNIDKIGFLHQPEYFLGSFDNPKMQARHEKELEKSLNDFKTALAHETDPLKALNILNQKDHIQFLLNNLDEFQNHDRLEQAVIELYSRLNAPFSSGGNASLWEELFNKCEKSKLSTCGEPFPAHIDKVYRGSVSGFKRSLAWTPDRAIVEKFAKRWEDPSLGGGELFEVDITADHVLVYMHKHMQKRVEEVVILSPDFIRMADIRLFNL